MMVAFPNYNEFYQKPLVSIGRSDSSVLKEFPEATHWLIAMEGFEYEKGNKKYKWKVLVFPSDKNGSFDYERPHFISSELACIHEAFELVKEINTVCQNDQFSFHASTSNAV